MSCAWGGRYPFHRPTTGCAFMKGMPLWLDACQECSYGWSSETGSEIGKHMDRVEEMPWRIFKRFGRGAKESLGVDGAGANGSWSTCIQSTIEYKTYWYQFQLLIYWSSSWHPSTAYPFPQCRAPRTTTVQWPATKPSAARTGLAMTEVRQRFTSVIHARRECYPQVANQVDDYDKHFLFVDRCAKRFSCGHAPPRRPHVICWKQNRLTPQTIAFDLKTMEVRPMRNLSKKSFLTAVEHDGDHGACWTFCRVVKQRW